MPRCSDLNTRANMVLLATSLQAMKAQLQPGVAGSPFTDGHNCYSVMLEGMQR